jgi:hypothetical protein
MSTRPTTHLFSRGPGRGLVLSLLALSLSALPYGCGEPGDDGLAEEASSLEETFDSQAEEPESEETAIEKRSLPSVSLLQINICDDKLGPYERLTFKILVGGRDASGAIALNMSNNCDRYGGKYRTVIRNHQYDIVDGLPSVRGKYMRVWYEGKKYEFIAKCDGKTRISGTTIREDSWLSVRYECS